MALNKGLRQGMQAATMATQVSTVVQMARSVES